MKVPHRPSRFAAPRFLAVLALAGLLVVSSIAAFSLRTTSPSSPAQRVASSPTNALGLGQAAVRR